MADSLCKFLDVRCITGSQCFATYFSAQKPFLFPTLVRRKRRRKSLHIAFCSTPISPNLDVVSTHEHSDGTLLFRFGDPREIAKEDELEEPLLDSEEEFSVVKVLDGDNEREVIVKKVEREARGEAVTVVTDAGVSESVVIGNGRNDFVEVETGLSENFLGDSADEIGSISPEGIQNESVAEVDIENAVHVEEIFEKKDDSEASVPPPPENSITSFEVEEEMMGQTSDESFEELDDDKSLVLSSPAAMPVYSDLVNTKEIEEFEGEVSSQLTENDGDKDCCYDSTHSEENGAASADIEAAHNDIEIVQQIEQISENIGIILEGSTESVPEGINLGNAETVADEISPENAPEGINLGNTETVVDEISPDNAPEGINLGNTETVVDEISLENFLDGIDLGSTETVVDEISLENSLDGIDLGNTETVVDEISLENAPDGLDLGNTETVVDEISLENAPDGLDLGNTETVVDKISPENALGGINLGNAETVVDEISPENVDIRHLSMDAEDQSIEVLNFENDDQTELSNLFLDTEDQASRNSTFKDSDVTEVMPDSPKLEAEPVFDEEVDHNLMSESNESESPLPSDENLPSLSLEEERKEDVENNEIMEVYGHEVVEDKSSEVLDSSKEATPAAAELILSSGATLLQYPSKAFAGGHEAYFIACGKWLGVADAVGSWSLEGSDPGVYAQELMQNSQSIVSQCDKDSINDPKQVLNLSVSKTDSLGSSTVLIAHFDGKALHVANIGDSGFIIVRNGNVYRKSSPMLHEFNLPIQIEKGDDPSQLLEEYKIELDEGDIIVTATDALFDNLYDQEIVSIASRSLEADKSPQEIAEILATRVQQVGSSASGRSPFADAAQAAGYVGYTGGKRDDVAVIVSVVQKVIVSNDN